MAPACLTNCSPDDVHQLLPRAIAAGSFASPTAAVVRNAGRYRGAPYSQGKFSSGMVSITSGLRKATLLMIPSCELITGSSCSMLSTPS